MPPRDPVPQHILARRRAIGERIRDARTAADITQERLAEMVGLTRNTIYNIETGTHPAVLDSLLRISDAVGVPLWQLVRI